MATSSVRSARSATAVGVIAMRLGRGLDWDPVKREIMGDEQANTFLARESRKGYETKA